MSRAVRTLLIDNYDSFTFNLYQLIAEVNGEEPIVVRNDSVPWAELQQWEFDNIVISPGPGRPDRPQDFGVCADAIRLAAVPLLGVCLGHQGLVSVLGGAVVHAPEVMHGRISRVHHDGSALFAGLPQGFEVVRYHSLCVARPLPAGIEVTAWTEDDVIMGIRDVCRPRFGVQFHPESIRTANGSSLLENFRDLTSADARHDRGPVRPRQTVVPSRSVPRPEHTDEAPSLVVRKLGAAPDAETVFMDLFADNAGAWWLDSSRRAPSGRFSFMGGDGGPLSRRIYYDVASREVTVVWPGGATETHQISIFDFLQRELDQLAPAGRADLPFAFDCGFVGYLGYELKAECGGSMVHQSALPDAVLQLADRMIAFDHEENEVYALSLVDRDTHAAGVQWVDETIARLERLRRDGTPDADPEPSPGVGDVDLFLSRTHETYLGDIGRCLEYLADGETYEVCLTNKVKIDAAPDPVALYRVLRHLNPAPFSAFLRFDGKAVACSSPERFLSVARNRWLEAKPIKGTAPRGSTPEADAHIAEMLRTDEKSRAENLMIIDLLRNDFGTVCEIGPCTRHLCSRSRATRPFISSCRRSGAGCGQIAP